MATKTKQVNDEQEGLPIINDSAQMAHFYLELNPRTNRYRYQHMAPARMKELFTKWHAKMRPGNTKTAVEKVMAELN
jgi:hypothetical protein